MKRFLLTVCWMLSLSLGHAHAAEPIQVTIRPLAQLLLHPQTEAPAETKPLQDGLISAQVAGTILEIPVQVGDRIANNDLLIRLDPWSYQLTEQRTLAELEGLKAQLLAAQKRENRVLTLLQQKQATQEVEEQRKAEVATLASQIKKMAAVLEEARIQIEKCRIRAPFAGVIVQRPARLGSNVAPGTPLIQLVDTEAVELSAQIATSRVTSLTQTDSWNFLYEGNAFPVRLRTLLPYADPIGRTQEARLQFTGNKPIPGSAGRLIWHDPRPHLPPWTLVQRDNTLGVFLVREGKAFFHPLPNAIEGHPVPVESELQGDVILSGREGLVHGATIKTLSAP
ncbi:MAG: efflux RND transporter periplasmic adaptor subunit [Magnetococcales bacterium]|nr:efflux RND transporter periplasmic adaptor subunit [Magnetococcales bacterium]MBF0439280.1 efflux RND transporter periplasmic adaptor subunit [Magnetococcales bacterium]